MSKVSQTIHGRDMASARSSRYWPDGWVNTRVMASQGRIPVFYIPGNHDEFCTIMRHAFQRI
jgi:DNA repair exonuclease SbcCD nuclease subunit